MREVRFIEAGGIALLASALAGCPGEDVGGGGGNDRNVVTEPGPGGSRPRSMRRPGS